MKIKDMKLSKIIEILVIAAGASIMLLGLTVWIFDLTTYFKEGGSGQIEEMEEAITVEMDKEFSIDQFDVLVADLYFVDINVDVADSTKVELKLSGSVISRPALEKPYLVTEIEGGTLTLGTTLGNRFSVAQSTLTLDIRLPANKLEEMKLNTSSGDIKVDGQVAESLFIDTNSGSATVSSFKGMRLSMDSSSGELSLKDSETGRLDLETSSGDLLVQESATEAFSADSSSGDMEVMNLISNENIVKTTSGKVRLQGIAGSLNFKSSSGSLDALINEMGEGIDVDSTSGDITLTLPSDLQFSVKADTTSGKFSIDFPLIMEGKWDDDHVEGRVGDGGNLVKIKTSSGDISIKGQ